MAKEVWRGLSIPFTNGVGHESGGSLMRAVWDTDLEMVTFEISEGEDAMGQPRWVKAGVVPGQFIVNAASHLANRPEPMKSR